MCVWVDYKKGSSHYAFRPTTLSTLSDLSTLSTIPSHSKSLLGRDREDVTRGDISHDNN